MKKLCLILAAFLTLSQVVTFASDSDQPSEASSVTPLRNKDVLAMVQRQVNAEAIVQIIQSSPCTFDTFPPVMQDLKRRGVPDSVLQAMLSAPYGPPANNKPKDSADEQPIYHYAEYLRQFGLMTAAPGRRQSTRSERIRASRPSSRRRF